MAQNSFHPPFDDTEAFQLVYQSDSLYTLDIAAAPPVNWALIPGGGSTLSAPAVTVFDDDLALCVRGGDDRLYVNWLPPNYQWTGWAAVPGRGTTPSTPAATVVDENLALCVRGDDDHLYENFTLTGP